MNVMCLGGRVTGDALFWNLVQTFLLAHFKGAERFRRRLAKVEVVERERRRLKLLIVFVMVIWSLRRWKERSADSA